jgi:hypothetical protein
MTISVNVELTKQRSGRRRRLDCGSNVMVSIFAFSKHDAPMYRTEDGMQIDFKRVLARDESEITLKRDPDSNNIVILSKMELVQLIPVQFVNSSTE